MRIIRGWLQFIKVLFTRANLRRIDKVCFIKRDTLYIGGTYIKCVPFYETDFNFYFLVSGFLGNPKSKEFLNYSESNFVRIQFIGLDEHLDGA